MVDLVRKTRVLEGVAPDRIPYGELLEAGVPTILRGVARDWPLVRSGLESAERAMRYLETFTNGRPLLVYTGPPEINGRFGYNADFSGFNFSLEHLPLGTVLERLRATIGDPAAAAHYVGSTDLDGYFPGLRATNDLRLDHPMFERDRPLVSLWMGNRTVAAAHYDEAYNLACCMVGRRRFSLFPPEQLRNMYPGPLEPTPGGQVVSMVDLAAPDLVRYPRFREALAAGQSAELAPGDVLFYPSLWWHNVEALDAFNVLINYWWGVTPAYIDSPQLTLMHALLSLRDRPAPEKAAWRALFDYYVFGDAKLAGEHLPEHVRGHLGPMDEMKARRLRAVVLGRLNR